MGSLVTTSVHTLQRLREEDQQAQLITRPRRAPINMQVPVAISASTWMFFVIFGIMSGFLGPLFIISTSIYCAFLLMFTIPISGLLREGKYHRQLERHNRQATELFGEPYERHRVHVRHERDVAIVEYIVHRPYHHLGQTPRFKIHRVRNKCFSAEQELEALELVAEWQLEAEENESAHRETYSSEHTRQNSAAELAARLQEQLPARRA